MLAEGELRSRDDSTAHERLSIDCLNSWVALRQSLAYLAKCDVIESV